MALNLKRKRAGDAHFKGQELDNGDQASAASAQDGDEEVWGGVDGTAEADGMEVSEPEDDSPAQNARGKRGKAKQAPTGEELRAIKDSADLFRSSSFKLQIDALVPNVLPKPSRVPPIERLLHSIYTFLNSASLAPVAPAHPLDAAQNLLKAGVCVPYPAPLPSKDAKWKVGFERPSDVTLVGSWAGQVSVKGKDGAGFSVDLAVEMPAALFQEKDYLNGRFFHKRAFFLSCIAAALSLSDLPVSASWEAREDDARLVSLVLTPKKDAPADLIKSHAQIRLIPVLPTPSPIPVQRLSPSHSNLRISTSNSTSGPQDPKSTGEGEDGERTAAAPATPLYNRALHLALTPKPDLLRAHELKAHVPAFTEGLVLLRVWANQRGFCASASASPENGAINNNGGLGIRGFEARGPFWVGVLALLIEGEEGKSGKARRGVGRGVSSYQLFRAALDFLGRCDWEEGVFVRSPALGSHRFPMEEYKQASGPVFVDRDVNLLAGMPMGSLDLLKHDAKKTLEILDATSPTLARDAFAEVFLRDQRDLLPRFDAVISVNLSGAKPRKLDTQSILDAGSAPNALLAQLAAVLRQGLGNRTHAVALLHPAPPARSPLSQSHAHSTLPSTVYIGLIYEPNHSSRLVDHGPAADDPDPSKAVAFREFWGDKAELRRFKDGRIVESVVWDVKDEGERATVPTAIVAYLLDRHFGVKAGEGGVTAWGKEWDAAVRVPEAVARVHQAEKGVVAGFKGALGAFDALVKALKALDDKLPLSLVNVSPASAYLRYTSAFAPLPLSQKMAGALPACWGYLAPMEIVLEFEKSARWPDELRAIQRIKMAFCESVAEALMGAVAGLRASVVVGEVGNGVVGKEGIKDEVRLEIVTREGWAFSARVWHDREALLLDRMLESKPKALLKPETLSGEERQEAVDAKELHTRLFVDAPRHHRAIASLCHRFAAFAGTVRLVKRWLGAHWLLRGCVSEEAVELLCAAVFVRDGKMPADGTDVENPAGVPGSKERGFACVVEFLAEWKWEDAVVVPLFGGEGTPKVVAAPSGKSGVWSIFTEHDKTGRIWTASVPDVTVAHRVRAIAKATHDHMSSIKNGELNVKALFVHPVEDYDFVIRLEPAVLPRYFQNVAVDSEAWSQKGKYANLQTQKSEPKQLVGFDPAQLLFDDLTRVYKDTLRFFYDPYGGDSIGAVWEPTVKDSRPFRVLLGFSSMPSGKDEDKSKDKKNPVSLNNAAIFNEIQRLGLGIVKSMNVRS
ncbi:Nrap protein [Athelia psychrophila]|uniref:U3 small nucleolar RNA-associated protein 22 n=1 Tax=Athelia psychrophila TaxID=1759441 RepID=A0A166QY48_9AGAM|nr:Nrap protein [Fibularhizoctonia sp. CBS 109695]